MKKIIYLFMVQVLIAALYSCSEPDTFVQVKTETDWPPKLSDKIKVDVGDVSQRNYYIIFDGSGSMSGSKVRTAKKALKKFIKLIPEDANIGLTAFDNNSNSERASLGSDRELILSKVDQIVAGGATPLGRSVEIAFNTIGLQANRQLGYGDYNLVIITDGQANDEGRLIEAVDYILAKTPIVIHTIGFQIGEGHPLNQPGKIYYKTASNFKELSQGLEKVLAELEDFTITEF